MWKIKFNQVQDLGDARFASSVMAEWLGFAIDGEQALFVSEIQEIIGWCNGPKLILEVGSSSLSKINSYLDVLPVDGIECTLERYLELKDAFPELADWIVLGDVPLEGAITHSTAVHSGNHLVQIQADDTSLQKIHNEDLWGFSLNCQKEKEVGKKDMGHWCDFFEKIEIL
jgi:hypothetical protein